MILVTHKDAVDFVNSRPNTIRIVVSAHKSCSACNSIIDVLNSVRIPFILMDYEDPEFVFKTGGTPTTFIFMPDNICYPRYDVYDAKMLVKHIEFLQGHSTKF